MRSDPSGRNRRNRRYDERLCRCDLAHEAHQDVRETQAQGPDDEGYLLGTNDSSHIILGGEDTPSQVLNANLDYAPNQRVQQW